MKLYAITKGCYSDYHICGIATSKEKAEKMVKFYSVPGDEAEIEEFEANQYNDEFIGKQLFTFAFENETNNIKFIFDHQNPENIHGSLNQSVIITPSGYGHYVHVWAFDERHAEKIAIDKYFEYKYKQEMGEN